MRFVERYQSYYEHIYYVRTPEREPLYASWNRAIKQARGRYITNANADDRHRHDALETLASYLDAHPQFALVYPGQIDTSVPNETFATTKSTKLLNWPPYTYSELERHCIIGSQPMWRRSLHDTYGYFREEFKSAGDYEFWLRIGKKEMFFRYPETLGLYYRNPEGIEHGSDDSKKETLRIWHEYGMFERGIPLILGGRLVTQAQIAAVGQTPTAAAVEKPAFDRLIPRFEEELQQRKYQEALETANLAITHYAELPYPYVLRAIALRLMQVYAPALEALHRSIEMAETPEALLELMLLSKETGNEPEARQTEAYISAKISELERPSGYPGRYSSRTRRARPLPAGSGRGSRLLESRFLRFETPLQKTAQRRRYGTNRKARPGSYAAISPTSRSLVVTGCQPPIKRPARRSPGRHSEIAPDSGQCGSTARVVAARIGSRKRRGNAPDRPAYHLALSGTRTRVTE